MTGDLLVQHLERNAGSSGFVESLVVLLDQAQAQFAVLGECASFMRNLLHDQAKCIIGVTPT